MIFDATISEMEQTDNLVWYHYTMHSVAMIGCALVHMVRLLSEEPINADTSMQVLESHKSPSDDVFGSEGLWTSTPV